MADRERVHRNPGPSITPISDFRKQAYLRWLCTPIKEREPRTLVDFALQNAVDTRTLHKWRSEKEFLEAWELLYLQTIGDPERKQTIMDTLLRTASDADDPKHVQAAKAYFEIEGSMKPARIDVTVQRPASELSDEQLAMLLAERAEAEKAQRDRATG